MTSTPATTSTDAARALLKAYQILLARHERMLAAGHVFEVDEAAEQLAAECEAARLRRLEREAVAHGC